MPALLILANENWKSLLYGNGSIFRLGGMIVLVIWSSPSLVCLSKAGKMIHIQAIVSEPLWVALDVWFKSSPGF